MHAQLQLVHPLVQLLVCQSLSPLWCPVSMGVLVASVLCYISRRSKESSHKPSSHTDPAATAYDEVGSNKKTDAMEMNTKHCI